MGINELVKAAEEREEQRVWDGEIQKATKLMLFRDAVARGLGRSGAWDELQPYAGKPTVDYHGCIMEFTPPESMELWRFVCRAPYSSPNTPWLSGGNDKVYLGDLEYRETAVAGFFRGQRKLFLEKKQATLNREAIGALNGLKRASTEQDIESWYATLTRCDPSREWSTHLREALNALRAKREREDREKTERQSALDAATKALEPAYKARAEALMHNREAVAQVQDPIDEPFTVWRLRYGITSEGGVDTATEWVTWKDEMIGHQWECIRDGGRIVPTRFVHVVSVEEHKFKPTDDKRPVCKSEYIPQACVRLYLPFFDELPEIPGLVDLPEPPAIRGGVNYAARGHLMDLHPDWPAETWA